MTIDGLDVGHEQAACQETRGRQETVNRMTDGTRTVRVFTPSELTKTFFIPRMTDSVKNQLDAKFEDGGSIDMSTNTFTIVDDYNQSYTCRLAGKVKFKRRLGRFWSAEFSVWVS